MLYKCEEYLDACHYSNVVCWYVLTLGDALYTRTQTRYKKCVIVVPILMDLGV